MSQIKSTARTEEYTIMRSASNAFDERNDCTVVASAIACGVTYAEAHKALEKFGRKKGKGVSIMKMVTAIKEELGFFVKLVPASEFISRYPKGHRDVLKHVTTHHPERFNDVWADGNTYIFFTTDHVAAVVNGVNHDWTKGRAKRVQAIFRVF